MIRSFFTPRHPTSFTTSVLATLVSRKQFFGEGSVTCGASEDSLPLLNQKQYDRTKCEFELIKKKTIKPLTPERVKELEKEIALKELDQFIKKYAGFLSAPESKEATEKLKRCIANQ